MKSEINLKLWGFGYLLLFLIVLVATFIATGHCQVSVSIAPPAFPQFFDGTGKILAGGFLYTYAAGTTTLQPTYVDFTGTIQNPDPIPLDATGAPSNGSVQTGIWLANQSYKLCLYSSALVLQGCKDNVTGYLNLLNLANTWTFQQTFTQPIVDTDTDNQMVFGVFGNQTTLDLPPPTGNITLHFPNTSGTLLTSNGNNTFTGTVFFTNVDGNTVYADQFTGTDMFSKANVAIASLTNGGVVILPSGTYSVATTLAISKPNVSVRCANSASCIYNWIGAGTDAISWRMSPFTIVQAGVVEGLTINCSGACIGTASNGLHMGDVIGARMSDLHISNFAGASAACLWTDNQAGWTERGSEYAVHLDNCTKAHRWTNTANTQVDSSFGHWPFVDERWNLNGAQVGWSVEGGIIYDTGVISITGNSVNVNTLFTVSGVQYGGGPSTSVGVASWVENVEQGGGGPSSLFNLAAGTALTGCGTFALGGFNTGTITGTLNVNGTACPINNNNYYSAFNTTGATDALLGLNASNITALQGDPTVKSIGMYPNPGTPVSSFTAGGFNMTPGGTSHLLCSAVNPTVSAGFNTGSIGANANGSCAFDVVIGGGGATNNGIIALPATTAGWNCFAANFSTAGAIILQTSRTIASATFVNYGTTPGTPVNWTNGDIIGISCFGH